MEKEINLLSEKDEKLYKFILKFCIISCVIAVIVFVLWFGCDIGFHIYTLLPMLAAIALPILVFGGIGLIPFCILAKNNKNKRILIEEFEREHPYHREQKFAKYCIQKFDIKGTSAADIARMKLAKAELGLDWDDSELAHKFEIGCKANDEEAKTNSIEKEQQQIDGYFNDQHDDNKRISNRLNLVGTQKRLDGLERKLAQLQQRYDEYHKETMDIMKLGINYKASVDKNESNWGLAGGIASGIAGPVAGMAAASQAYAQGERERQAKVETANQLNKLTTMVGLDRSKYEAKMHDEIKNIKEKINITQRLISSEEFSQSDLMKMIKPMETKTKNIHQDVIRFEFTTREAEIKIYETVDAYIDGYYKVIVKKNGLVALERYFELPDENGSLKPNNTNYGYIKGKATDKITFEFVPINLWGVENK